MMTSLAKTPIALTMGEPAGIGPDIILDLWQKDPHWFYTQNITIIGCIKTLRERAEQLNISADPAAQLTVIDTPTRQNVIPGVLTPANSSSVITSLNTAVHGALRHQFRGIVTAPVHKGVINDAGISFAGHTIYFTELTNTKQTVMMLMTKTLKVALVTNHIPLSRVPSAITHDTLSHAITILHHDLQTQFHIASPRILVCGLNPHAGENGHLGKEEITTIIPVIHQLQQQGIHVFGPISADVAFTPASRLGADVILAMYHDQGLPTLKAEGFHSAINVTLGLPFLRTSVDHGTALPIAGSGKANSDSLKAAILCLNTQLQNHRHAPNKTASCA